MAKFHELHKVLTNGGIIHTDSFLAPKDFIDDDELMDAVRNVHCPSYLHRLFNHELRPQERREIGLHFGDHGDDDRHSQLLIDRTLSEVRGTAVTVDLALKNGIAVNLAGGTHHAHYDKGSGFCVLNDLAISANRILNGNEKMKILILDCDVHQGDGTAAIFGTSHPNVYTLDLHCGSNFPYRKSKAWKDVSLKDKMGDDEYLHILRTEFEECLSKVKPDLVIYDAGVDIHEGDRLGALSITSAGLYKRDFFVLDTCFNKYQIPVAAVIGGGYDPSLELLAIKHSFLHRAAIDVVRQIR